MVGFANTGFARNSSVEWRNSAVRWGIRKRVYILLTPFALAACNHTEPGIEVRTVEVVKEVQKPCPGTVPDRPAALGSLASTAEAALAQALAKLAEYSGDGQYADRAEAYFETCPPQ